MRLRPTLVGTGLLAAAVVASACSTAPAAATAAAAAETSAFELVLDGEVITADADLDELCRDRFGDVEVVDPVYVGLMTDSGSVNDGTFNQFAYEGMQAAARCFGLETTYVATGASDDYAAHLRALVAEGVDAVVTVGFDLIDATVQVAGETPEVAFIGIDQPVDYAGDNYARVTYRDDQGGFLAGAAAGMLTESGVVGVVAGVEVPPVMALADGFEAGIAHVRDDVTVLREHLPSFSDQEGGAAKAAEFLDEGADVIYAPAGLTGSGAILRAGQRGAWVIGVDQDQYLTTFEGGRVNGADRIATSTVKRVDLGVFLQLADLVTGTFRGDEVALDAATGGVTYAPAHEAVLPPEVHERLERIRLDLASGALMTDQPGDATSADG